MTTLEREEERDLLRCPPVDPELVPSDSLIIFNSPDVEQPGELDQDSLYSLTPVADPATRKKSQSLSYNDAAQSLFRSIRRAYSLDTNEKPMLDIVARLNFDDATDNRKSLDPTLAKHHHDSLLAIVHDSSEDSCTSPTVVLVNESFDMSLPPTSAEKNKANEEHIFSPVAAEAEKSNYSDDSVALYEKYGLVGGRSWEDYEPAIEESKINPVNESIAYFERIIADRVSPPVASSSEGMNGIVSHLGTEKTSTEVTEAGIYEKMKREWEGRSTSRKQRSSSLSAASTTYSSIAAQKSSSSFAFASSKRGSISNIFQSRPEMQLPVYERLYASHSIAKEKAERKAKANKETKREREEAEVVPWQIVNERSIEIVATCKAVNQNASERLYRTGLDCRQRRLQRSEDLSRVDRFEDWSCAKCGSMQKLDRDKYYNKGASHGKVSCTVCGFVGSERPIFKPTNIALGEPITGSGAEELKGRVGRRNVRGSGDASIHNFLYKNPKVNPTKYAQVMNNVRQTVKEALPFKPTIPETSEQIISNFKHASFEGNENVASSTERAKIGEYFKKDPIERLYEDSAPEIRKPHAANPKVVRPKKDHIPYIFFGSDYGAYKKSSSKTFKPPEMKPPPQVTAAGWDIFVQRLLREENKRRQRIQKKTFEYFVCDDRTGQELWKPKIPEPLQIEGKVVGIDAPPSSFDSILFKEKQRKERRQNLIRRQEMEELEAAQKARVTINPLSAAIINEATERGIDEIYRVLLASISLPSSQYHDLDRAREITRIANEMGDWAERSLDISLVRQGMLIPNVMDLVVEAFQSHLERHIDVPSVLHGSEIDNASADASLKIDLNIFRKLIHYVIKRRRSLGLSYSVAARKRDQLGRELDAKRLEETTFAPDTTKSQAAVAVPRFDSSISLADALMERGELVKCKIDAARTVQSDKKMQEKSSFKPFLFKAPSYIKPRYRGLQSKTTALKRSENYEEGDLENQAYDQLHHKESYADTNDTQSEAQSEIAQRRLSIIKEESKQSSSFLEDSVTVECRDSKNSDEPDDISAFTVDDVGREYGREMSHNKMKKISNLFIHVPSSDTEDQGEDGIELQDCINSNILPLPESSSLESARSCCFDEYVESSIQLLAALESSPRRRMALMNFDPEKVKSPSYFFSESNDQFDCSSVEPPSNGMTCIAGKYKDANPVVDVHSPLINRRTDTRNMKLSDLVRQLRK